FTKLLYAVSLNTLIVAAPDTNCAIPWPNVAPAVCTYIFMLNHIDDGRNRAGIVAIVIGPVLVATIDARLLNAIITILPSRVNEQETLFDGMAPANAKIIPTCS